MKEYNRYFCYKDQEYAPEELGIEAVASDPASEPFSEMAPLEEDFPSVAEDLSTPEPLPEAPPQSTESVPPKEDEASVVETTTETPPAAEATSPTALNTSREPARVRSDPEDVTASPGTPMLPLWRPPLVKEEILRAKKAALLDLAAAHSLDSIGTKEELRVRLLAELNRLRREELRAMGQAQEIRQPDTEDAMVARPRSFLDMGPIGKPEVAEPAPLGEAGSRGPGSRSEFAEPASKSRENLGPSPTLLHPEAPKILNPCPTCGRELTYIEQYDRYYCEVCRAYAPLPVKVVGVPPPPRIGQPCPRCGRELTYIEQYDRHYCYHCKAYAPLESKPSAPPPSAVAEAPEPRGETRGPRRRNPCPTCGRDLNYIARYARYYCYDCERYAPPRPKHPCPNCGKSLTYIAQYGRHYCYACTRYAPAALSAQILAARAAPPVTAGVSALRVGVTTHAIAVHRNGSLSWAVGLVGMGLTLLVAFQLLVALPLAVGGQPYVDIDQTVAWSLQFLGLLLLGVGAVMGFLRLRDRR